MCVFFIAGSGWTAPLLRWLQRKRPFPWGQTAEDHKKKQAGKAHLSWPRNRTKPVQLGPKRVTHKPVKSSFCSWTQACSTLSSLSPPPCMIWCCVLGLLLKRPGTRRKTRWDNRAPARIMSPQRVTQLCWESYRSTDDGAPLKWSETPHLHPLQLETHTHTHSAQHVEFSPVSCVRCEEYQSKYQCNVQHQCRVSDELYVTWTETDPQKQKPDCLHTDSASTPQEHTHINLPFKGHRRGKKSLICSKYH